MSTPPIVAEGETRHRRAGAAASPTIATITGTAAIGSTTITGTASIGITAAATATATAAAAAVTMCGVRAVGAGLTRATGLIATAATGIATAATGGRVGIVDSEDTEQDTADDRPDPLTNIVGLAEPVGLATPYQHNKGTNTQGCGTDHFRLATIV